MTPSPINKNTAPIRGVRTIASIKRELERLAERHSRLLPIDDNHHGSDCNNSANMTGTKAKKKNRKGFLQHRHIKSEFHGNYADNDADTNDSGDDYYLSLFEEFAITVCHTGVIPRKELFEAWAMALYVNHYFPTSGEGREGQRCYQRVADLCSGHGLVSWAILFLDEHRSRTAVCIDISIPKACDIVESVMLRRHPEVATFEKAPSREGETNQEEQAAQPAATPAETSTRKRWHWIEGDICRNVSADSSTLIVGVHCCGTLSDSILDLAIQSGSALALVPCCHTRRSLPYEYKPHKAFDALIEQNIEKNKALALPQTDPTTMPLSSEGQEGDGEQPAPELLPTTLTDVIDGFRIERLVNAGFDVQVESIPSVITPKNRIIVASPPPDSSCQSGSAGGDQGQAAFRDANECTEKKTAPNNIRNKRAFSIPLGDTPEARAVVASQSGRLAANLRDRRPAPNLSLSIYLPSPDECPTEENLQALADRVAGGEAHRYYAKLEASEDATIIRTQVRYGADGVYSTPDGRFSRSYRIQYGVHDETGRLPQLTKQQAKELHALVCRAIEEGALPGIKLRQGMKRLS
ncbi:unnamed protein product [Pseudo-nitzschia multistriata]|uniref:Methyltransferase domain-containing protein n=1 Tax=Pseudo-nitzschia multistriata TaxID=183589 RepID=A0A448YV12_9STRA|nr:unnamed protein product [Pseudo-nitzschia multistriata]